MVKIRIVNVLVAAFILTVFLVLGGGGEAGECA